MLSLLHRRDHISDTDLAARVDGELRARRLGAVERHLAGCADCRSRLAAFSQTKALLAMLPKPEASRSFRLTPAMAAAQTGVRVATARPRALVFAPAVALTLLVALLGADFALVPANSGSSHATSTTASSARAQSDSASANDALRKSAAPASRATSSAAGAVPVAPVVPQTNAAQSSAPPVAPQPALVPQTSGATPAPGAPGALQPSSAPPIVPQAASPPSLPPTQGSASGSAASAPTASVAGGAFGSASAAQTPSTRETTLSTAPTAPSSPSAAVGESNTRRVLRVLEVVTALALGGSLLLLWRSRRAF